MEDLDSGTAELVPRTVGPGIVDTVETPIREELLTRWKLAQRSLNTVKAYERDVRDFFDFCDQRDIDVLAVDPAVIDFYRHALGQPDPNRRRSPKPYADSTIARKLSALSSFYGFAVKRSPYVTLDPTVDIARPSVADESTTRGLDLDEARRLRAAADELGGMDGALVHLLLGTGLRVSEACNATTDDLETERGHRVITVRRKGGKKQRIAVPEPAAKALDRYTAGRTGFLFLMRGKQITRQQAADALARVAAKAGITERISPHSLRHAAATLMLDAGVSLRDVQRLLGHVDPRTTMRYDRARHDVVNSPVHILAAVLGGPDNPPGSDEDCHNGTVER